MKYIKTFVLGLLAGLSISLGGLLFVTAKNFSLPILGSFLFSIGLLLVCSLKFNLFTGKIGYVFDNKKGFIIDLVIMYIGNFAAAVAFGYLMHFIGGQALNQTALAISSSKLFPHGKDAIVLLGSSFFCGALVYLAVNTFKMKKLHIALRVIILIFCVATFVVHGFDHCIANMFYFAFGNTYATNIGGTLLSILFVTIGNSLGAIFVNCIFKLERKCSN